MKVSSLIIALLLSFSLLGQKVSFTLTAPKAVEVGQNFQITYSLNSRGRDYQGPQDFPGFNYLGGPYTSQSSSTQIINGKRSQSINISYTYQLRANKAGTFKLPPASVTIGQKKVSSNQVSIKVVSGGQSSTSSAASGQGDNSPKGLVFARTLVSKRKAYVGEPIVVTLKIYSEKKIVDIQDFKAPTYDGLWIEDIDIGQLKLDREAYGDKVYYTVTLQKALIFPQTSGTLEISPFKVKGIISVITTRKPRDQWEYMMYGNQVRAEERKSVDLNSPSVKLDIKALPDAGKPDGFNDVVGNIKMQASIDKNKLEVNDALNLKVKISGQGNINQWEVPAPLFPPDFEVYDPKTSSKSDVSVAGMEGSKSFEYLIIPRNEGTFIIPPLSFSYFDVTKKKYVSLKSDTFRIQVGKGSGKVSTYIPAQNQSNAELLARDIRYIKTGNPAWTKLGMRYFNSALHLGAVALMPLLLILILYVRKQMEKNNRNTSANRHRKATRVAKKRLQLAAKYQKSGDDSNFYLEISRALWGYLSDKFSIPRSELSMDTVRNQLQDRMHEQQISEIIAVLNDCEFARFAPEQDKEKIADIYNTTLELISTIEKNLKS
jgi:hypothetical protein